MTIYEANNTMHMLGRQASFMEMMESDRLRQEFKEIQAASCSQKVTWLAGLNRLAFRHCLTLLICIYDLGVIHGIRKERQRRKTKSPADAPTSSRAAFNTYHGI